MRRLAGAVVGIVLVITTAGVARAQRRIRFESLGGFELYRQLLDEDGKPRVILGGALGVTADGTGGGEGLAGVRYAARSGIDYLALDTRLSAAARQGAAQEGALLDGTHRAIARVGNIKLDLAIDHSALGRSYSLRPDVAPEPYRDVSVGAGLDFVISRQDRDSAIVAPLIVRGRRVTYEGSHPGLASVEVSVGVGTRFDGGDPYGEKKGAIGTGEMFGVSYIGTRIGGSDPAPSAPVGAAATSASTPVSVPPGMSSTASGQMIHEVDFRLLGFDRVFFRDGPMGFAMYIRMGYAYLQNATTGEDGGVPMFRYGNQMGDATGGMGLLYSIGPGVSDDGEIISVWRVEAQARGRRPGLGAWEARFGWTCGTPDDTDDVCGEDAVGRAAIELESYLDVRGGLQLGASYLGDYGPRRAGSDWRNEALAFLRWEVAP
jgi:hypothetical protein